MKKLLYILIPLVLFALVALRLKSNKDTAQGSVFHYNKEQAIRVQADTLHYEQAGAAYAYTGTFEPNRETKISAEVQGKIRALYVTEGSFVKAGQQLLQLDNELLKLQLQAVDVQIEGLEADVNRFTILAEADAIQGVQLEKAVLGLKSARVQRNTILEQIRKGTVTAPFSGIITAKLAELGAVAAPGMPLLQLSDLAQLKFTVNVPEKELRLFQPHQTYAVLADAYPQNPLSGQTTLIGSKANPGNSFPVQLAVQNTPDFHIKSGMFGKVQLLEEDQKHLLIPASAVVGSGMQPQVYVLKAGKARLQNIIISRRINDKAIVESGLAEGDVIATAGFINLFDGATVQVN